MIHQVQLLMNNLSDPWDILLCLDEEVVENHSPRSRLPRFLCLLIDLQQPGAISATAVKIPVTQGDSQHTEEPKPHGRWRKGFSFYKASVKWAWLSEPKSQDVTGLAFEKDNEYSTPCCFSSSADFPFKFWDKRFSDVQPGKWSKMRGTRSEFPWYPTNCHLRSGFVRIPNDTSEMWDPSSQ